MRLRFYSLSAHLKSLTILGFQALRSKLADKKDASLKILSDNRKAGHDYFLMERFEAGMVLTGTEVKAAKDGKVQLMDAYASVLKNEAMAAERPHQPVLAREPRKPSPRYATASCCCTAARSTNFWAKPARRASP